ncbi:MAG: elongation factor G [Thermotogae bacterium]|nr:elongation factor G [Thermotogota bacterium]MCL5032546.1 elongation factor G [Thermotogota bacterium]
MIAVEKKRVIAFIGHNGSGKTTLCESILFTNKIIERMGSVDQGNTVSDFDPVEIGRKTSVNATVLNFEKAEYRYFMIDTPGFSDFIGEVISSVFVADNVCSVLDSSSGVEVQTEKTWRITQEYNRPSMVFVNDIDKEFSNFDKTVEQFKKLSKKPVVIVNFPLGEGTNLKGIVDVVAQNAHLYSNDKVSVSDVPSEFKERLQKYRTDLVESVVELDESLMEKYLADQPIEAAEISKALSKGYRTGEIVPVLCGSALKRMGINEFIEGIQSFGASPLDNPKMGKLDIKPDLSGPFAALIFKVVVDPFIGKLTYAKVLRGQMKGGDTIYNGSTQSTERVNHIYFPMGKKQNEVSDVSVGDIVAVPKLKDSKVGDFLSDPSNQLSVKGIFEFPEPMISKSVKAKNTSEIDKITNGLTRLAESDPTFHMEFNPETGEIVISGIGNVHLEVTLEKLKKNFGVEAELGKPKIAYRETIVKKSNAEYKHKKQTGGHGQYGHVKIELEPLERGKGFEFVDKIFGGAIPKNFIPSVEKGIREGLKGGVLGGYPVDDVRVILYDGSYHEVDSSDIAFQIAAIQAFKIGLQNGNPTLLEPIMSAEIYVPDKYAGDIMGDLNSMRGRIQGMEPSENGYQVIKAEVPLAEILDFSSKLNSMTSGQGYFTMKFSRYEEVPRNLQDKIIQDRKADLEANK